MSVGKITAFGAILCSMVWGQYALAQDTPPPGAAALPPPPGAGAPPPAVTGSNVNLRQGPGTTYTVITLIPAGSPLNVSGCNAGWCQVGYQGQNGYIIATAIAPPGGPGGPPPGAVAGGSIPVGPPPGYIPPPPPYYYGYYGRPYYGSYYAPYGPYWRRGYYHRHW